MDTSDPEIEFDENGICSHCQRYEHLVAGVLTTQVERERRKEKLISAAKRHGAGREYDCLIGVSGGVDSTYVALTVKRWGLRPLAVHMDNGWNSSLAVTNIQKTMDVLGIDLHTEVLNWDEFKDLQLAFLKASTPDSEVPTDHAIGAVLMRTAYKFGIKYILTGSNIRSEGVMPTAWVSGIRDWKYIKAVHDRFGSVPLLTFPHYTMLDMLVARILRQQKWINVLNLIEYNKTSAMAELESELGWTYYGGKHFESVYTRFFQSYILPEKFGIDKRRAHLSALICSGEITRAQALEELETPACPSDMQREDTIYVLKKLGMNEAQFRQLMAEPRRSISDYPAYENTTWLAVLRWMYRLPRRVRSTGA